MDSSDPSSNDEMLSGRMDCWSWNVDAADAKKAEGASLVPGARCQVKVPGALLLLLLLLSSSSSSSSCKFKTLYVTHARRHRLSAFVVTEG